MSMLVGSQTIESPLLMSWGNPHNPLLAVLAVPLLGLAVNVVFQVGLLRLTGGRAFMKTIALGFLAGGSVTLAAYLGWMWNVHPGEGLGALLDWFLLVAPAYAGLAYGYANFANLGNSSIRIRLYEELRRAPNGLPLAEIRGRYNEATILENRLQRLRESGDLILRDSLWRVGRKRFVRLGGVIFFAKQLVLRRRSEFDPPPSL